MFKIRKEGFIPCRICLLIGSSKEDAIYATNGRIKREREREKKKEREKGERERGRRRERREEEREKDLSYE